MNDFNTRFNKVLKLSEKPNPAMVKKLTLTELHELIASTNPLIMTSSAENPDYIAGMADLEELKDDVIYFNAHTVELTELDDNDEDNANNGDHMALQLAFFKRYADVIKAYRELDCAFHDLWDCR